MTTIHATCLLLGPIGILVRGASGSGKTGLALALIDHMEGRGGFARLVADDRVAVAAHHGRLVARAPEEIAGLVELRGLGIVRLRSEPAAVVRLVVDIVEEIERMPSDGTSRALLDSVSLPRIEVPRNRDQAMLLVMAALGTFCTSGPLQVES
jgi:HPr kinase/phosphorylase